MFDALNERLGTIFTKLRRQGRLTEADITSVMREVRIAMLEADVALPVVKDFIASLKERALGADIVKSVSPANMVVKLVQDHITALLGSEHQEINLATQPPAVIMMVGLQGSGKTTSTAKLAYLLAHKYKKKVLVASLDVYRPAAQEQLRLVAEKAGIAALDAIEGQMPVDITRRALQTAKLEAYDVLLLDTAGRLHIDTELMDELVQVRDLASPIETLLTADALTGQDAVQIGREFHEKIGITGAILTRIDGDGRGGAALSLRHVTGQPIKFIGTGEKITDFDAFYPERIAARILDMGDIVSLVEKATEQVDQAEAEQLAKRMQDGQFDFNDMLMQLRNMKRMGGMGSIMSMMPGMGQLKDKMAAAGMDESIFKKQEAIILSMHKRERRFPKLLNASRKKRIAAGSGTSVQEVNQLFKHYQQMEKVMKKLKKMGGAKGMMRGGGIEQLLQGLR
ncbi:MAG: signal recognition particle protein [Sphaerospermopsis sp. SIO1G2]|nr:signal recognition particle protein [Sphaerospermopsis sp. SIO1G2]